MMSPNSFSVVQAKVGTGEGFGAGLTKEALGGIRKAIYGDLAISAKALVQFTELRAGLVRAIGRSKACVPLSLPNYGGFVA